MIEEDAAALTPARPVGGAVGCRSGEREGGRKALLVWMRALLRAQHEAHPRRPARHAELFSGAPRPLPSFAGACCRRHA
jgi:hypothetical protein